MAIKAVAFDIAGPLFKSHPLIEFVEFLSGKKIFSQRALRQFQTLIKEYKQGAVSYETAAQQATELFGSGIQGQKKETIQKAADQFVQENQGKLLVHFGGLLRSLQRLRVQPNDRARIKVALVSTEPYEFVRALGKSVNIPASLCYGTRYDLVGGRYTGLRNGSRLEDRKELALQDLMKKTRARKQETVYLGDRTVDRKGATAAGVIFIGANPKEELISEMRRQRSARRQWLEKQARNGNGNTRTQRRVQTFARARKPG